MTGLETSTSPVQAAPVTVPSPQINVAQSQPSTEGITDGAAALVELSGVSPLTVETYEQSVPPNLATAAALTNELAARGGLSTAERSGVFALMDRSAVLALSHD